VVVQKLRLLADKEETVYPKEPQDCGTWRWSGRAARTNSQKLWPIY